MSVYKDKAQGTWYTSFRYVDWTGKKRQKMKRGFKTKREALNYNSNKLYEEDFGNEFKNSVAVEPDMQMAKFVDIYFSDKKNELKANSIRNKQHMINKHIIPYFGDKKLNEITPADIIQWQKIIQKNKFSKTYERMIQNQINALFNHAQRIYNLKENPCKKVKRMGKSDADKLDFWTKEEYKRFAEEMMDKPLSYYAFQLLYWCGIRSGELLALTPTDFNFKKKTLRINKSYQRLKGEDVISTPKTKNSVRTVIMPQFLCDEMQDCLKLYYSLKPDDRIFPVTKYYLNHEMERGCKASGVKKIRVHDLRHSHVSLLINMGYTALAIGKRVGHSAEKITYRYAHLFPSVQQDMAEQLDAENMDEELNEVEGGLANVG